MSEERPVPRRESPWGLPEGDNRQPKAHRCNDRAEDVVQGGTHRTEPYTYLQLDPPKRAEVKLE